MMGCILLQQITSCLVLFLIYNVIISYGRFILCHIMSAEYVMTHVAIFVIVHVSYGAILYYIISYKIMLYCTRLCCTIVCLITL